MRRLIGIAGAIVVLLLGAALVLSVLVDANRFRPLLESELSAALSRKVQLGSLKLAPLRGSVAVDDLTVADNPAYSKSPFLKAKSAAIRVELWPLLVSRKLNVTGVRIERPAIALIQGAGGEWNFSSLGGASKGRAPEPATPAAKGAGLSLSVKSLRLTGGEVSLALMGRAARPLVLRDLSIDVTNFSASSEFPFTLDAKVSGGGSIALQGKAGPLNASDTAATPLAATFQIAALDLARSGLTQSASAFAGIVSLDGSAQSDGSTARLAGKLKAEKLKLARSATPAPKPVTLDFAVDENRQRRSGRIEKGAIHIGSAQATLTGTFTDAGGITALHMNLDGPNMAVSELSDFLPAMGVVLPRGSSLQGGTASAKLSLEGPLDRLVTAGSISLDNTKLANFDLGKKLAFAEMLAGMKPLSDTVIQTLGASLHFGPEGGLVEDLKLIVPSLGNLEGSGTVSPSNDLAFQMRATVRSVSVPFTIQGTAAEPAFRPDTKAIAKEQLNKVVGGESVKGLLKGFLGRK
jgi:AsmA protein